jgi:phosphoribosylamine--glycine ligase
MGCYSISKDIDSQAISIVDKFLRGLSDAGTPYIGILYLGMIVSNDTHYVLEINTRPGNPEFNTIIDMIDEDILDIFVEGLSNNTGRTVKFKTGSSVSIQVVHKDYKLLPDENIKYPVFNNLPKDIIVSYGSLDQHLRYCNLTTYDISPQAASKKIQTYLDNQYLGDFRYRSDIGIKL